MKINVKPQRDVVVAIRLAPEEKSEGGIVLPSQYAREKHEAEVVEVGPEVKGIKVGDIIWVKDFAGSTFEIRGNSALVLKEEEIDIVLEIE